MFAEKTALHQLQTIGNDRFRALVLDGQGPIAVEFMSYGCAHCRALEPVLQNVAEMVSPGETIYRVNVAVDQTLSAEYSIAGTPTLVMFLDGREVGRVTGPHPTVASVMAAVTAPFAT